MKRRVVLKQILLAAAGTALIPSCTWDSKKTSGTVKTLEINTDQEALMALWVDSIIPATDIPGAKALGVPSFVLVMLDDCYDKESQTKVVHGLTQLQDFSKSAINKSFEDATPEERETLLVKVDSKDSAVPQELQEAYAIVKRLTIQGFLGSQYVMTEISKYEMIPGRFDGCFPISSKATA